MFGDGSEIGGEGGEWAETLEIVIQVAWVVYAGSVLVLAAIGALVAQWTERRRR